MFCQEAIPANTFVVEYAGDEIQFGELMARVHRYEYSGKHNFCFEIYGNQEGDCSDLPCLDLLVS